MTPASAGRFVGNPLQQIGDIEIHGNSERLESKPGDSNGRAAWRSCSNLPEVAQTRLVEWMSAASADRFVGNPLEQHGQNKEHANSKRVESKPNSCNRKMSWASSGNLPK